MSESFGGAEEPVALFERWLAEAEAAEPRVANAMQLATVNTSGQPSLRTVLLKHFSASGFVFFTNLHSRKGQEIEANPLVALLFHWKSQQRQVVVRGRARLVHPEQADAYWATRPRGSQIAAWASQQSRVIDPPGGLPRAVDAARALFNAGDAVPRPPHWSGFCVAPAEVEFWQGREDRLHDRLCFTRNDEQWEQTWLYP